MPGFWHFLFFVMLLAGAACAGWYDMLALAIGLALGGVVGIIWVVADSMWVRHNDELYQRTKLTDSRTKFVMAVSAADGEARQFLGKEWPELGMEFNRAEIYLLADGVNTGVLLAYFQRFLQDSNATEFADLRKYNDDKFLQERFNVPRDFVRKQWYLATELLSRQGCLMPDSMRGSHTFQWKSKGHYKAILRRYMNVREIPEMTTEA